MGGREGIGLEAIRGAADRVRPRIHRTPVLTCRSLDRLVGARLFFKCENFQKAGSFKIRGAANAVFSLSRAEAARGVATHSSGNHAQALALAASWKGCGAWIVMPVNAAPVKRAAVEEYGATVVPCAPTLEARERTLEQVRAETGAVFIHPYDDGRVIAGQGTAALEFLEDVPDLDALAAPVGGGGLMSGTVLAASALRPGIALFGVEPEGADDAKRSLEEGRIVPSVHPRTIADGLLTSLGRKTFPILREHLREILTVPDAAILEAMKLLWERMKIVVEPSGAVPLAALLLHRERFPGERIGLILTGGNTSFPGSGGPAGPATIE